MGDGPRRRGRRPVLDLTDPQRRTLHEVREFIARRQFPPTVKELAGVLGIAPASAHEQILQLIRKGYLKRDPGKARGLVVLREADDGPTDLVPVPVLGEVSAGTPLLSDENIIGEVLVEGGLVRSGRHFALRVKGESMKGAGIADRDLIIVRQQPLAESGEIVVALVDGEAMVKRLIMRGPQIELQPENPRFKPLALGPDHDLRIVGKVVAVRR